jgi:hypothetical protein
MIRKMTPDPCGLRWSRGLIDHGKQAGTTSRQAPSRDANSSRFRPDIHRKGNPGTLRPGRADCGTALVAFVGAILQRQRRAHWGKV